MTRAAHSGMRGLRAGLLAGALAAGCALAELPAPASAQVAGGAAPAPAAQVAGPGPCATTHLWSKRVGGPGSDGPSRLAVDRAGNILLAVVPGGTVDFGAGPVAGSAPGQQIVGSFDGSGKLRWAKRIELAEARLVQDPAGTIRVVGFSRVNADPGGRIHGGEVAVTTLDESGRAGSPRRLFSAAKPIRLEGVDTDSSGRLLLWGNLYGTVDLGGGPIIPPSNSECFVAAYDATGGHRYSRGLGDGVCPFHDSVRADPSGGALLAGAFTHAMSLDGRLLTASSAGHFIARLDAAGKVTLARRLGEDHRLGAAALLADGTLRVASATNYNVSSGSTPRFQAHSHAAVEALDPNGDRAWIRYFPATIQDGVTLRRVEATGSGRLLLVGHARGGVDFGGGLIPPAPDGGAHEIAVVLDGEGRHLHSQAFDGVAGALHGALVGDDLIIAGTFKDAIDLGGGALRSAGDHDVFLARLRLGGCGKAAAVAAVAR